MFMSKRHPPSLLLSLASLVASDHAYRHGDQFISFAKLSAPYHGLYSNANKGRQEKGVEFGLRALVLPFIDNLNDRQMARCLTGKQGRQMLL